MPTLYTYCIRYDNGAAPNPYWGICTLVICKPQIRRAAQVGDWIVGTGSRSSPLGDISGQVVYAMKVTKKMTMAEYDSFTIDQLPQKIPDWGGSDYRRRIGDSIYDFSVDPPAQRRGIHTEDRRERDLGGHFALLSDHYVYFGDQPKRLPEHLLPIVRHGQGHRSRANDPYLDDFVDWIAGLGCPSNMLDGQPQQLHRPSFARWCGIDGRGNRRSTCEPAVIARVGKCLTAERAQC
ncbi:MAG TPA: hypothetical protein VK066_19500 [Chloroflexota bacterium]|nr:hypothetical protein [Chloroflexota bacterium]